MIVLGFMHYIKYKKGRLHIEDTTAEQIAQQYGTPCYVYSASTIVWHYQSLAKAFAPLTSDLAICYSVKANWNLSVLNLLREQGAGFDVVSGGEIFRALRVGADPKKIVFAGVGKNDCEIEYAMKSGVLLFNVESEQELANIDAIARRLGKIQDVTIRINPHIEPHTHKYIATGKRATKFGIAFDRAKDIFKYKKIYRNVRIRGLHTHIGSQITSAEPYVDTLEKVVAFWTAMKREGAELEYFDLGGGFGIWYKDTKARDPNSIASVLAPYIKKLKCRLILEPGRFIIGNSGVMLTRVQYEKESADKNFLICDAGMNVLIRPALYQAYHKILPAKLAEPKSGDFHEKFKTGNGKKYDVVGPICESGDFLAKDRKLPKVRRGELLVVFSAGAYGYSMASNYNSIPRPAEVMVLGKKHALVTERESYEDLVRKEKIVRFTS